MVDMEPHALVWPPSPTRIAPTDDEGNSRSDLHSKDGPLQPVPSMWTTLRLLGTWHWASAGQHYQASRAREQTLQEMHELSFISTIYLLIIGTLAVTGIPSAGGNVEPASWKRDVWAAICVGDFLLTSTLANTAFYIYVGLNSCDDDAEALRFLDELELLAVLPHRLFTICSLLTSVVLIFWLFMDFGRVVTVAMLCILLLFLSAHLAMHFRIVRASVSSKARPVEGPAAAGALRRAASKANLEAMMAAGATELVPVSGLEATQPGAQRRSAMRGARAQANSNSNADQHVHFGDAA